MIRINLLPVREKKKKESTRKMFSILALFLGLVALVIAFFHLSLSSQIWERAETRHDQLQITAVDDDGKISGWALESLAVGQG